MADKKMPFLRQERRENYDAESTAGGHSGGDCVPGGPAASSGLHGGVTDRHGEITEGLLGILLAAASAAICAAIDCLVKERKS